MEYGDGCLRMKIESWVLRPFLMTGKKKYMWDGSELGWNGDILSSMMRCLNTDKIEIREKIEGRQ